MGHLVFFDTIDPPYKVFSKVQENIARLLPNYGRGLASRKLQPMALRVHHNRIELTSPDPLLLVALTLV